MHDDAERVTARSVAIAEQAYNSDPIKHVEALETALNYLGLIWLELGRARDALGVFQRCLELAEKRPDRTMINVAGRHQNLAAALGALGRYEEARASVDRYAAATLAHYGEKHLNYAMALASQAALARNVGRYGEAEALQRRALEISEEVAGRDSVVAADRLVNIANLLGTIERYDEAKSLYERALVIYERSLEKHHSSFRNALYQMGAMAFARSDYAGAEQKWLDVLKMEEASQGVDGRHTALTCYVLGKLYKTLNRVPEATAYLQRAQATYQKHFGITDARLGDTVLLLGEIARMEGRNEDAEALFRRAFALTKSGVREFPVYFATDRQRDGNTTTPSFSGERGSALTLGLAVVAVTQTAQPTSGGLAQGVGSEAGIVSDAGGVTDTTQLSIRRLDVRAERELIEAARGKLAAAKAFRDQVFVFVHGYNVGFDDALKRTAQIAHDLNFDGPAFLFSWPSRGRFMSYGYDQESAGLAVNDFIDFLDKVVIETKPKKIHLIAHSMGNMVLLPALEKINFSREMSARLPVGEIVLASPDVDKDRFAQMVCSIKGLKSTMTLYASTADRALWASRVLRDFVPRAGGGDEPVIVPGVDTIDVTDAGAGFFALNHDVYAASPVIVTDMRRIFQTGERPPERRSSKLVTVQGKAGVYWRYRAPGSR